MVMSREDRLVEIIRVHDHYEGHVDGVFTVSGDTWSEVYDDLVEMGYLS